MAIAQPVMYEKKKMVFMFIRPVFHLHHASAIATFTSNTNAVALKQEAAYGNGSKNLSGNVRALCQQGQLKEALDILRVMEQRNIRPDSFTYASLLQECVNRKALSEGKLVHDHMVQTGFKPDATLGTKLVIMYAKCGNLVEARRVLDEMPQRNVVSWTAMIGAYVNHGCGEEALALFYQMQRTGIRPDQFAFASVLPACSNLAALQHGKKLHEDIIRVGFESDIFVASALVDMYSKCGRVDYAHQVFDKMPERNTVSWNAMIAGYAQNGYVDESLKLFQKMPERNVISWNSMIAGHAQNGLVDEALRLFREMPEQNVVSWNAMIAGYAQNERSDEALKLFGQMRLSCVQPNSVTFASVLAACANLAALHRVEEIHEYIIRNEFVCDVFVASALVDMYAKCGCIGNARKVFDKMPERDVVSWNAMIGGYAMHGCVNEALQLLEHMQHSGKKPDGITFIGILSACCHAGLVDAGWQYFDLMNRDYDITPVMDHYCCMVDLLGRSGRLNEAQDFINKMPVKPNAAVWVSLLGACRIHSNVELGERVAEHLFELDPQNSAHYVLLSNIYAAAGRWDDKENVRKIMRERTVKRTPGCSWIEVNNKVHAFRIGDRSHPQTLEIYAKLKILSGQIKEAGYVPDTSFVLHDMKAE